MKKNTYYNRTDSQVVVDDDGRIIGGQERGEFPETKQIRNAVNSGLLTVVQQVKKNVAAVISKDTSGEQDGVTPTDDSGEVQLNNTNTKQKRQEK